MPRITILLLLLVALVFAKGLYHHYKPLPPGISVAWPERALENPRLLIDRTWVDAAGNLQQDQQIFDQVVALIRQARRLVVVDMFLFNDSGGGEDYRPLTRQLTEALLAQKRAVPGIQILVITDPFNTLYGGTRSPHFDRLREAGIPVVETNLSPLRDPNPLWSTLWRLCCQWFGNDPMGGWLPSPVSDDQVPLRSYLALFNVKANHRKTLVVDWDDDLRGLVTSANPHDGSARHDNVALVFGGAAAFDLLLSELAVAAMSGVQLALPEGLETQDNEETAPATITGRIVTEGEIRDAALAMIDGTDPDDGLDLAMFYLAHREIIDALIRAHRRGVEVRVLLDANKDAFGREKTGIPNRPAARDLHRAGIPVRWRNTHGEQFHTKALVHRGGDGAWRMLLGSANFTRRNLDDYNLETDILVAGQTPSPLVQQFTRHFDALWSQGPGQAVTLSLPYPAFSEDSFLTYWRYRLMEATGLSTF